MGRLEWFDTIVIGDECLRAKPDPLPYQVTCPKLLVYAAFSY
jgi:phosphoglycolate phosphatase-like HAD superfamily hydrolase